MLGGWGLGPCPLSPSRKMFKIRCSEITFEAIFVLKSVPLSHAVTADWLSHFYMLCGSNIMHIHCTQMCTFNNSTIVLFMQSNVWNCCLLDEHMWFLSSNIGDTHTVVQKLGFNFCKLMCTHTLCVETALQSVCCLLLQVKVTPKHSEECKRLLTLMGVPYIDVSAGLDTSTRIIPVQ